MDTVTLSKNLVPGSLSLVTVTTMTWLSCLVLVPAHFQGLPLSVVFMSIMLVVLSGIAVVLTHCSIKDPSFNYSAHTQLAIPRLSQSYQKPIETRLRVGKSWELIQGLWHVSYMS